MILACIYFHTSYIFVQVVLQYRRCHLTRQAWERANLERLKRDAAEVDPITGQPIRLYMSGDGFTEYRTAVPYVCHRKHHKSDASRLQNRQIGVEVICGPIAEVWLFNINSFVRGGANCMIEVMRQAISEMRDCLEAMGYVLPRKAYFEFDNCGENKNRVKFAYYSMLVELGYFDEIEVYFLIVGHTHTSLDQFFSVLSRKIYSVDFVGSPMSMQHLLLHAHSEESDRATISRSIEVVYDVKEKLSPHVLDIHNHQVPYCFRFSRCADGKSKMQYKLFSSTGYYWLPVNQSPNAPTAPNASAEITVPEHPNVGGFENFLQELTPYQGIVAGTMRNHFRDVEATATSTFMSDDPESSEPTNTAPTSELFLLIAIQY
jgi:hypothetical protein